MKIYFAADHPGFETKHRLLEYAIDAVQRWLKASFLGEARHARRISQIDDLGIETR